MTHDEWKDHFRIKANEGSVSRMLSDAQEEVFTDWTEERGEQDREIERLRLKERMHRTTREAQLEACVEKAEGELKQILDALQLKLQPGGSPPSGGPVILAAWIINEANAQIRELKGALRDVLDAFWDMSPLEYARSRDLPEMSDAEGERILEKARRLVKEKP